MARRKDIAEAEENAGCSRRFVASADENARCAPRSPMPAPPRRGRGGSGPGSAVPPCSTRVNWFVEIERVLSKSARHARRRSAFGGFDELRNINDRYGRVAGDAALRHVARQLKSLIRSSDLAARNGAGAFSLLLDHLDADSALDTAERVARCIAAHPLDLGHAQLTISVTASVASILPGDTVEEVLRRAARNRERVKEF